MFPNDNHDAGVPWSRFAEKKNDEVSGWRGHALQVVFQEERQAQVQQARGDHLVNSVQGSTFSLPQDRLKPSG